VALSRAQRSPAPRRERRRAPAEPLDVVVEYATEDDPAARDFAVAFLQRLLARAAKR
jgi:hypothetical protein